MSWSWDFGAASRRAAREEERKAYLLALQTLIDSQTKMADSLVGAVKDITATQSRQIDAINTHLSLFRTADAPTASAMTGAAENRAWAEQNNFPFDGTPEQQAAWIEAHDTDE